MSTTTPCADRLDDGTPPLISVTAAVSGDQRGAQPLVAGHFRCAPFPGCGGGTC